MLCHETPCNEPQGKRRTARCLSETPDTPEVAARDGRKDVGERPPLPGEVRQARPNFAPTRHLLQNGLTNMGTNANLMCKHYDYNDNHCNHPSKGISSEDRQLGRKEIRTAPQSKATQQASRRGPVETPHTGAETTGEKRIKLTCNAQQLGI
jgi:hypothetical protein